MMFCTMICDGWYEFVFPINQKNDEIKKKEFPFETQRNWTLFFFPPRIGDWTKKNKKIPQEHSSQFKSNHFLFFFLEIVYQRKNFFNENMLFENFFFLWNNAFRKPTFGTIVLFRTLKRKPTKYNMNSMQFVIVLCFGLFLLTNKNFVSATAPCDCLNPTASCKCYCDDASHYANWITGNFFFLFLVDHLLFKSFFFFFFGGFLQFLWL